MRGVKERRGHRESRENVGFGQRDAVVWNGVGGDYYFTFVGVYSPWLTS